MSLSHIEMRRFRKKTAADAAEPTFLLVLCIKDRAPSDGTKSVGYCLACSEKDSGASKESIPDLEV